MNYELFSVMIEHYNSWSRSGMGINFMNNFLFLQKQSYF